MKLGVQTHFAHGWNTSFLDTIKSLGINHIRDEQQWANWEPVKGTYSPSWMSTQYMAKAKAVGVQPLVQLVFGNKNYDGGHAPYTEEGRQAYANYALAMLDRYGGQVKQVEVWNEYNGGTFVTGPATQDRIQYYTEMLKDVYTAIKAKYPDVQVVGASTVRIPLPYLEKLFQAGALDYMDAVSVHPYRPTPEGVDEEVTALRALMRKYGGEKPIIATEYGRQVDDVAESPAYLVKMTTLLASSGVDAAYWYVFKDHPGYERMGLFDTNMNPHPALAAHQFLLKNMGESYTPVRMDLGGPRIQAFKVAPDLHVVWGLDQNVRFDGNRTLYDARGTVLADVLKVSDQPVYVRGDFQVKLDKSQVAADTLADYNTGTWAYFARSAGTGKLTPLSEQVADPNGWDIHIGISSNPFLTVGRDNMVTGWSGAQAMQRYVATEDGMVRLDGEWSVASNRSTGVKAIIMVNGTSVWSSNVVHGTDVTLRNKVLTLKAGDRVDVILDPAGSSDFDNTKVHVRLTYTGPLGTAEEVAAKYNIVYAAAALDGRAVGTAAKDVLVGAAVADLSSSKDGMQDVFVAPKGTSLTVRGFEAGTDKLDLGHWGLADSAGLLFSRANGNLVLSGTGGSVTLVGAAGLSDAQLRADLLLDPVLHYLDVPARYVAPATTPAAPPLNTITGTSGGNSLSGTAGGDLIQGLGGNDTLKGLGGDDRLEGGDGSDKLFGGAGDDTLLGGAGTDAADFRTATTGVRADLAAGIATGEGSDTLSGIENITGSDHADTLVGDGLRNSLWGGKGNDALSGAGDNDKLYGQDGDDRLDGGAGNDWLEGGPGSDVLAGGSGADIFRFAKGWGLDSITDFTHGSDKIDLRGLGLAYAGLGFTDTAEGLLVGTAYGQVMLVGLDLGDVSATDFKFV